MHVLSRRVARLAGIDQQDIGPCSGQDQSRVQARRAGTDDDDVVGLILVHETKMAPRPSHQGIPLPKLERVASMGG